MATPPTDLTGKKVGFLTVTGPGQRDSKNAVVRWNCRCDCGTENLNIPHRALVRKESRSCGQCDLVPKAAPSNKRRECPIGKRFGRWTVLSRGTKSSVHYFAKCDCGTTKQVQYYQIRDGKSTSCGCFRGENIGEKARIYPKDNPPHLQHTIHNPLYAIWLGMKTRCFNKGHPTYKNYGARGVTVCPAWKVSFHQFATYIGPRPSEDHTVERIDNNGNYEPGNIRWADKTEQAANTRNNPWVTYEGQTIRLRDLADQLKIDRSILRYQHIIRGCPLPEAIEKATRTYEWINRPLDPNASVQKPHTSFIDLTGVKFINGYTAVQYQGRKHRTGPALWLARCDACGKTIIERGRMIGLRFACKHPKNPDDFC
jgi:hypothetical protein